MTHEQDAPGAAEFWDGYDGYIVDTDPGGECPDFDTRGREGRELPVLEGVIILDDEDDESTMQRVCAWCDLVVEAGCPTRVTHTICAACLPRMLREVVHQF